jgi:hypothetical protein
MAFSANLVLGLFASGAGLYAIAMTLKTKSEIWPITGGLGVIGLTAGGYSVFVGAKNLRLRLHLWRTQAASHEKRG